MPTLVAGSKTRLYRSGAWRRTTRGFTLLELIVVITIIAFATAALSLAMQDSQHTVLAKEAQSLAASLEAARAQARAQGQAVRWRLVPQGFVREGTPPTPNANKPELAYTWSNASVTGSTAQALLLGPEPMIPAQSIRLWSPDAPQIALQVSTDGLRPFVVSPAPGPANAP